VADEHCSFWLKSKGEVGKLIVGPGGAVEKSTPYICNECVMLCVDIFDQRLTADSMDPV
jgi:ATP-dependent protease Clp ATPase subunit